MKKHYTPHSILFGLALMCLGATAGATEVGRPYFSAFIGNTNTDVQNSDLEDDDTSFRLGGGYRLNKNFALEGYFIDYGGVEDSGFTAEGTAIQFQGVGLYPATPSVGIYGKLGLALWDAEVCSPFGCADDDGSDIVFGFGGSFGINERTNLRAEIELAEFDDVDLTTLMVGIDIGF